MTTIKSFVTKCPVLAYYVLAFTLSWIGVLTFVGGPGGIPVDPERYKTLLPFAFPVMLVGPVVAAILLTGLVDGRAGFRELRSRLLRWRVEARWYAVALLIAPLAYTVVPLALSLVFPLFLPGIFVSDDKWSLLLFGVAGGLAAGVFEELGWTGFAIPRLRLSHGILATGVIAGTLWGAWHLLVNAWASGVTAGGLPLAIFLPAILFDLLVSWMPAYRTLMVWVYDRTGSLLVAMLMHASLTASSIVLAPVAISGVALIAYDLAVGAGLWGVVMAVALVAGRQQSQALIPPGLVDRRPSEPRPAADRSGIPIGRRA